MIAWLAIICGVLALAIQVRRLLLDRRAAKETLRFPDIEGPPRIDVKKPQLAITRACRLCGATLVQHPAMVNDMCADCLAAKWEAGEEKDKRGWEKGGSIITRDFMRRQ